MFGDTERFDERKYGNESLKEKIHFFCMIFNLINQFTFLVLQQ